MKIPRAVIATTNRHKLREIITIAKIIGWDTQLALPFEFPGAPAVIEDGTTYEENAKKKAVAMAAFSKIPAIAEDSGLEIMSLGNFPGMKSARWADEFAKSKGIMVSAAAQSAANLELVRLLDEKDAQFEARDAKYVSFAAMAFPDGRIFTAKGENYGRIADSERGTGGFGFDPIFCPKEYEYERTFGELGDDVKNTISHRKRAIENLFQIVSGASDAIPAKR